VVGIQPGTKDDFRVVLSGEILATLLAPIKPDGSFEFPMVLQGTYIERVAPRGMEAAAAARPRTASENVIRVTDRDLTAIAIAR